LISHACIEAMNRSTLRALAASACVLTLCAAGCAQQKKSDGLLTEKDMSRVVTLADGTRCVEPPGLAESRQKPGAIELKNLAASELTADEVLQKAPALKLAEDEAQAVYFDVCRAYSNGALPAKEFEKMRAIYAGLRRLSFAQGVKQWLDKKDGIAEAGKLCLVIIPGGDPDHRSFTRVVPADSLVSDCAQLAIANGSAEILLGCTNGHWDDRWARNPIALGKAGALPGRFSVKASQQVPDPNCGWD